MNDSGNNIVLLPTGELKLTGFAPTVTVAPSVITEVIEKSDLTDINKTIVKGIILKLTGEGYDKTKEIILKAYETLGDDFDLFDSFIKIIKSLGQFDD